jgi:hypothetical protein
MTMSSELSDADTCSKCGEVNVYYTTQFALCKTHYLEFKFAEYKQDLDYFVKEIDNSELKLSAPKESYFMWHRYGQSVYHYRRFVITVYESDKDKTQFTLTDRQSRKLASNEICSIVKRLPGAIITKKIDIAIFNYFATRQNVMPFFEKLVNIVKKYHRRGLLLGDISKYTIGVYKGDPVILSPYAITTSCNQYGDYFSDDSSLSCDIVTGAIDCLDLKMPSRYTDFESLIWFYLWAIGHPFISKVEKSKTLDKQIKKKRGFLKKIDKVYKLPEQDNYFDIRKVFFVVIEEASKLS